jgi:Tfp pilus assembly protein PilN
MSKLRLDYQKIVPFPWAGVALLGVVMAGLLVTSDYYFKLDDQTSLWETKLSRIKDKAAPHKATGKSAELSEADLALEVNNANQVLHQISAPWDAFFQAVESAGGGKATLLTLEPDVEKHEVKIIAEAKDFSAVTEYLTQLQAQPVFSEVYLQNHHVQMQDPDKPVRFSLLATWKELP